MTLTALRKDALTQTDDGLAIRLGLPWIRSLPLASLVDLRITVDGEPLGELTIDVDGRRIAAEALVDESGWWFLQDRLVVRGRCGTPLETGSHAVSAAFGLIVPYLQIRPDAPLVLPFRFDRELTLGAPPSPASRAPHATAITVDRAEPPERADGEAQALPAEWTLAASAFNWTPEVIRAARAAPDIAIGIVSAGVASTIEIEPGQLWRSYPESSSAEARGLRDGLDRFGGSVSIVGASLDDWVGQTYRRSDEERLTFLLPQMQTARDVGAEGVRLPIGQAGGPLLRRLLPTLHDLDLVLYEEIQGQQTPGSAAAGAAIEAIADLDDPRVRVLVDISMFMPSLPPSYLDRLSDGGVPQALLQRLATEWRDPATHSAVLDLLRSGGVPPQVHTMFMNLLVRFGRSEVAELRGILPFVGAFHLKFWDLDDADGRIGEPIRELGAHLAGTDFVGTLCSEWGGHEWIDADPTEITRAHLALARDALAAGARTPSVHAR